MKETIVAGTKVRAIQSGWDLLFGKTYTLLKDSRIFNNHTFYTIRDEKEDYEYDATWFEVVPRPSMEEQLQMAKSYIAQVVLSGTDTFIAQHIVVYTDKENADKSSYLVQEDFKKHGYSIAIKGSYFTVPVLSLELAPKEPPSKEVKLNDTYTAKVTKDTIEVGCQTFPISILDELFAAHESLS